MENISSKLIDAQDMRINNPDTFGAPNKEELDDLAPGAIVKICNNVERFWVIVSKVENNTISGTVDNMLVGDYGYNCGDDIEFEKCHIYAIT